MYWDLYLCMGFGILTFTFSMIITISQFYQVIKTKNTSGVSLPTYCIFFIACCICLAWAISYYIKLLISHPPEGCILPIPPGAPEPYGPYWLWQWTILPVMAYYAFNILIGVVLFVIKFRHLRLAKKLNMSEIDLSYYLLHKQKDAFIKSGRKIYRRKYFSFVIIITILLTVLGILMTLWATRITPHYHPEYYQHQNEWSYVWIINIIGSFACEIMSWPQFIKSLRQKDTSGISWNWAIFLPISMTVSFIYALSLTLTQSQTQFPPDTLGALIFNGLIVNYGILIIKLINKHNAKRCLMTEIQYTKKFIYPDNKRKHDAKEKRLQEKKTSRKAA